MNYTYGRLVSGFIFFFLPLYGKSLVYRKSDTADGFLIFFGSS